MDENTLLQRSTSLYSLQEEDEEDAEVEAQIEVKSETESESTNINNADIALPKRRSSLVSPFFDKEESRQEESQEPIDKVLNHSTSTIPSETSTEADITSASDSIPEDHSNLPVVTELAVLPQESGISDKDDAYNGINAPESESTHSDQGATRPSWFENRKASDQNISRVQKLSQEAVRSDLGPATPLGEWMNQRLQDTLSLIHI